MQFRDPVAVIDEVIADLDYLTEFFLDDIDHCAINCGESTPRTMTTIAALEATRTLLPRLRIVRSNFVSESRVPDASAGCSLLSSDMKEGESNTREVSTTRGNAGLIR